MVELPSAALARLRIDLPPAPRPVGSYAAALISDGHAFVSGQIVTHDGAVVHPGLVGAEVDVATAKDLARRAALQALSAVAAVVGSVDRIRQVVRVVVYVASSPGFHRQHEVANGATDVLVEVFGDRGRPARAAVGVAALPLNAPVEVELLVALG